MGRREASKDQKRTALIGAGMQLFIEQGLAATTVDQITAAADVAKGTFYNYFSTKEDLLVAGMLAAQAESAAVNRAQIFALPTAGQRLNGLVRWSMVWITEHPELAVLWCLERLRRGFAQDGPSGYDDLLLQIIAAGQAVGELRSDRRPEFMATEISGIFVTYIVIWYHSGMRFDLIRQMEEALAAYLGGNAYQQTRTGGAAE